MPTAQVVTITEGSAGYSDLQPIRKIKWVWTATDAGIVAASTTAGQVPTTTYKYTGELVRLITIPAGSTSAPDDNYDVTVLDEDGYDVLMSGGLNRDTANTEQVLGSSLGVCLNTTLSLRIAGAGDANGGTVILYIKRP